jgi:hypothetical protein
MRWPVTLMVVMAGLSAVACSPAARQRTAAVIQSAAAGAGAATTSQSSPKIMVFGGVDHKTYLGCLNCNEYASDSIFNAYGTRGSAFSTESIWNHFSEYGSEFSTYSACSAYASDPPVIVDGTGAYYGRLSINQYHPQLGAGAKYHDWLTETVCK